MKKAQEKYNMIPLPIPNSDESIFENQVFCTKDFYDKRTLVLYVHDAPDVIAGPNALSSSKMDLSDAFLVLFNISVIDCRLIRQVFTLNGLHRWVLA
jgi:histone deacetylase 6